MNVHISYKLRKTPDLEKEINHLVEKLRKRLQVFRPELLHLKGVVEESSPREGTTVSLNLRLPSGQLAAQRSAHPAVVADALAAARPGGRVLLFAANDPVTKIEFPAAAVGIDEKEILEGYDCN